MPAHPPESLAVESVCTNRLRAVAALDFRQLGHGRALGAGGGGGRTGRLGEGNTEPAPYITRTIFPVVVSWTAMPAAITWANCPPR